VLLLDDLYQSGVSMNYGGLLLVEAGASKVFGLSRSLPVSRKSRPRDC